MKAHRADTKVSGDGSVTVHGVPFPAGEEVEVIVLPHPERARQAAEHPLRGSVRRYDDPFGPAVPPDGWNAA